jgi:hypothetical protein
VHTACIRIAGVDGAKIAICAVDWWELALSICDIADFVSALVIILADAISVFASRSSETSIISAWIVVIAIHVSVGAVTGSGVALLICAHIVIIAINIRMLAPINGVTGIDCACFSVITADVLKFALSITSIAVVIRTHVIIIADDICVMASSKGIARVHGAPLSIITVHSSMSARSIDTIAGISCTHASIVTVDRFSRDTVSGGGLALEWQTEIGNLGSAVLLSTNWIVAQRTIRHWSKHATTSNIRIASVGGARIAIYANPNTIDASLVLVTRVDGALIFVVAF